MVWQIWQSVGGAVLPGLLVLPCSATACRPSPQRLAVVRYEEFVLTPTELIDMCVIDPMNGLNVNIKPSN